MDLQANEAALEAFVVGQIFDFLTVNPKFEYGCRQREWHIDSIALS